VRSINKPPMSDRQLRPRPPRTPSSPLSSPPLTEPLEGASLRPPTASGKNSSSSDQRPVKKPRITKNHSPAPPDPLVGPSTHTESSDTITFHPMTPRAPSHEAHNLLPSSFRGLDAVEPIHIFNLFLTNSLLDTMSTNTNAYAEQKIKELGKAGAREWVEVTPKEIGAWIGIVLYMGCTVHKPVPIIGSTMASTPPTQSPTICHKHALSKSSASSTSLPLMGRRVLNQGVGCGMRE
jgi:hypothetical protein